MAKSSIISMSIILCGMLGCQNAPPAIETEDPDSVRRVSNFGLLKRYAEVGENIPVVVSSAIRDMGISFTEIQHGEGKFEYQAETNTGERILIEAAFLNQGSKIYIEIWGEETAAELLRDQLTDAIKKRTDEDMIASGILKESPQL